MLTFGIISLIIACIWKAGEKDRIERDVCKSIDRIKEIDPEVYDDVIKLMFKVVNKK